MKQDLVQCPQGTALRRIYGQAGTASRDLKKQERCSRKHRAAISRQENLACWAWKVERSQRQICTRPDGTMHGPAVALHNNGTIWWAGSHRRGKLHGRLTEYHPNGQKAAETSLVGGVRCGSHTSWTPDGEVEARDTFPGKTCAELEGSR